MKKEKNSLLYSLLLSMNDLNDHEVTAEDLKYMHDTLVNDCQIKLYMQVVEWLSQGKSFDEIFILLDNIELEEYKKLGSEKQNYLQKRLRKDINSRKYNELKKGEMKYE